MGGGDFEQIAQLGRRYGADTDIIVIDEDMLASCRDTIKSGHHVTLATYYRLLCPLLLPADIDKVLYLDCDMVITGPILPLWNTTEISDYAVGAVVDENYMEQEPYLRLGFPPAKKYFNAGMMLINLDYWRRNRVMERCLDYIGHNSERLAFHDQDTLNVVLQDEKLLLPIRYNFQTGFLYRNANLSSDVAQEVNDTLDSFVILHYTGPNKPWLKRNRHPFRDRYLRYKALSPWSHTPLVGGPLSLRDRLVELLWRIHIKSRPKTYIVD